MGSVIVVLAGIIPTLLGGPVFATLMVVIGLVGFHEFRVLASRIGPMPSPLGYVAIAAFAVAGSSGSVTAIVAITIATVFGALAVAVVTAGQTGVPGTPGTSGHSLGFIGWVMTAGGALYLGLPVATAIALRQHPGQSDAAWLNDVAATFAFAWDSTPLGLGWAVTFILVTWLGDTLAYLVGRAVGRRALLPRVSPKKTVEGAIGGLIGSGFVGGIGVWLFGLDTPVLIGILIGAALGIAGQIGDLGESLLKRQAGVKDSGAIIRGHGGMLDRVDALVVVLSFGWIIVMIWR